MIHSAHNCIRCTYASSTVLRASRRAVTLLDIQVSLIFRELVRARPVGATIRYAHLDPHPAAMRLS